MILKLKFMTLLLAATLFMVFAYSPKTMAFDLFSDPCSGGKAASSAVCQANGQGRGQTSTNNSIVNTIKTAANIVASVAGVGAVIMIIIGGFRYVTSGGIPGGQRAGDASGVKDARTMITNAVIGLIIVALAWTITRFITDKIIAGS